MRITTLLLCFAAGGLGAGCAHGSVSRTAQNTENTVANSFDDAYAKVRSGAESGVQYGQYVLDSAGNGAVRVYRSAKNSVLGASNSVTGTLSDAQVTAEVKSRLTTDKAVNSRDIHVSTDAGVVTLEGTVRDQHEASRAVEDALAVNGVYAVDSRLDWGAATGKREGRSAQ